MKESLGMGERILKDFARRMRIFDGLVKSILAYFSEVWGWSEN